MKYEDEVKTKPCPQCGGTGRVKKIYNFGGIESTAQCPVCDGYGFLITKENKRANP